VGEGGASGKGLWVPLLLHCQELLVTPGPFLRALDVDGVCGLLECLDQAGGAAGGAQGGLWSSDADSVRQALARALAAAHINVARTRQAAGGRVGA